ncbi:MAG TPA: MBL fold metallo-hydrolase [Burkholderiales bacterium]|nr:MBL fold metallo-hydrolase [Burkholderiales bacterium]
MLCNSRGVACFAAMLLVVSFAARGEAPAIRVTLLGTGSPPPVMNRFGPSTLVEAGGTKLVFDAGRGALQRLNEINVRWDTINAVFLTHLHSDHTVGFPDLWLTGWLVPPGRRVPLLVYGPAGTQNMMTSLRAAYDFDIRIRIADDGVPEEGVRILTKEISDGVIFDQGGVKVTAFPVDHEPVKPALGFRVDYGGRSVVLSGDTRYSENLIGHAQNADVLIHEIVSPSTFARSKVPPERAKIVIAHHTTPEEAAEIFSRTKPRLAVYSHLVQPTATADDVLPQTRARYSGRVELGEDLMVIEIGENVTVRSRK